MAETADFTWGQGEDLTIELIYKEGLTAETAVAIDLSIGYAVRMDIVVQGNKEHIYTFNSAALTDYNASVSGNQPDTTVDAALSNGSGGTPNIAIVVPRTLTLPPAGAIYKKMLRGVNKFDYDIFLRNTVSNRQVKVLKGTITVEESDTLWL